MEHPEWYIQLPYSPFPSYTFNGPDLSWHPDIGIYLEDHYYDRTDAAVVFKRVDKRTGEERYIYHGNDGTSMPWNDTAQLDYTREEVREAVIRTIIEVAKKAPIIRFDAAMTLTKRHFHRLWFPPPGSGGDIPSRSDYGMTREQFDRLMPKEFWREVVDRVAEEVPDTLLLAEAFWLMEGYFVRTLGMHRVYNSAFMNMLKNEENDKYLATIKKTIEFDPEILKRYVNFMNNPDEETAIHQFGDGDKYFGVCTMLVTMPGLPMFGHGQVEGFREKYGMEYRRAYWDEVPNQYLIERHEKEIFPLMKKRYLFAEVQDFQLYDFYLPDGSIDPNVFAYSNSHQGQHSLVVYHNAYRETRGNIHLSSAKAHRTDNPEEKILIRKTLAEALQLTNAPDRFCVFRDHISGLEFIYPSQKIYSEGLPLTLRAYEYHVFLDFREIQDDGSKRYHQLAETLNGQGVENVETAAKAIFYQPLHEAYSAVMDSQILQEVETFRNTLPLYSLDTVVEIAHQIENRYLLFLSSVKQFEEMDVDHAPLFNTIQNEIKPLLFFDEGWIAKTFHLMKPRFRAGFKFLSSLLKEKNWYPVLWHWVFLHDLGKLIETEEEKSTLLTLSWLEEWQMENCLKRLLNVQGVEDSQVDDTIRLLKLLIRHQYWFDPEVKRKKPYLLLKKLLQSVEFQHFLKIHEFDGILWFNKESFEKALEGLFIIRVFQIVVKAYTQVNEVREQKGPKKAGGSSKESIESDFGKKLVEVYNVIHRWKKAMIESEYQIEKLLNLLK
ncbi:MAG: hypothetical protein D6748_01505 [Calditrichaeota bacterium]|nr:MAG: hypothetical protein D6748_01505 [Calditrichota bacterium]